LSFTNEGIYGHISNLDDIKVFTICQSRPPSDLAISGNIVVRPMRNDRGDIYGADVPIGYIQELVIVAQAATSASRPLTAV
jgi:hypothetical protein